ncbi:MAG: hypothetical protein QM784_27245 [Polyangiaceae bacterium]
MKVLNSCLGCWFVVGVTACATVPSKGTASVTKPPSSSSPVAAPLPPELGEVSEPEGNATSAGTRHPEFRSRVLTSASARISTLPFSEGEGKRPDGAELPNGSAPQGLAGTSSSLAEREGVGADVRGTGADRGGLAVGLSSASVPKRDYVECVVVQSGSVPRVVVDLPSGLRLLLYVAPSDLGWTVSRPTWLPSKPSEEETRDAPGPTAFPGLVLEVLEETQQWRHVAWDDGLLRAEGWLPAAALKHEFTPVLVDEAVPVAFELAPGTLLLDCPKGTVVAQIRSA